MADFTKTTLNYPQGAPSPIRRVAYPRAPTTTDYRNFVPGDEWLDTSSDDWWKFVERTGNPTVALWVKIGGTSAAAETFTGNSGGAVGPDAANNINLLGADTTTVVGNPATNTLTITTTAAGYPITPYVVGPVGQAGYQTIQEALDAANADGGGIVGVQPGTYTEDLTLYDLTEVVALGLSDAGDGVTIIGVHIPPATGGFVFRNLILQSATDIFNSAAAGSSHLIIADSAIVVTNGYTFNLPNWTGKLETWDVNDRGSTNDGYVNNTGGSEVVIFDAAVGAGSANSMITTGPVTFFGADVNCPVDFQTGSQVFIDSSVIIGSLTFSNNSTADITTSHFAPGANPAITHSSSGAINISECVIESSNNPAIDGAGAGTFTYTDLVFLGNATIAGTLTTANGIWRPFSQADAVPTPTDNGTCHFDSAAFQVDTDGFVQLVGGGSAVEEFLPDTGTSPVVPNASGQVSVLGQATPNTSGIQVTGGTNSLNIAMFSPFAGGNFGFVTTSVSGTNTVFVENPDNTMGDSNAAFSAISGGTSSGDPYNHWVIPATRFYSLGIDNSDSDNFKLTTDVSPVSPSTGTNLIRVTSSGATSVLAGNLDVTRSNTAGTVSATVSNTDNTAASASSAAFVASVGGTTQTGDAFNQWSVGSTRSYALGPDTNDSQNLKLTTDAAASVTPSGGTTLMQISSGGQVDILAGDLEVERSSSGGSVSVAAINDSTDPNSRAVIIVASAVTTGQADASILFSIGAAGQRFNFGIDQSDNSNCKLSATATLGSTDTLIMTPLGECTMPLQPSFLALKSAAQDNVTGNGTQVLITYANEIFDQGGDYNTGTSIFTSPVAGRYFFRGGVYVSDAGGSTSCEFVLSTSNRAYRFALTGGAAMVSNQYVEDGSTLADMDAADTAGMLVTVSGIGADTADLGNNPDTSNFSGFLAC